MQRPTEASDEFETDYPDMKGTHRLDTFNREAIEEVEVVELVNDYTWKVRTREGGVERRVHEVFLEPTGREELSEVYDE